MDLATCYSALSGDGPLNRGGLPKASASVNGSLAEAVPLRQLTPTSIRLRMPASVNEKAINIASQPFHLPPRALPFILTG